MKDDNVFNLSDIFPERKDFKEEAPESKETVTIVEDDETTTSYLLVNALLYVLIKNGIIQESEVNSILLELHQQYRQNKKS